MPCPSKWPLPTMFCLLDNCVGWVRGVDHLVCFGGYQPSSRWGLCEKDQWCSAPVWDRSLLPPPCAQPSPPAVPGLSLLAQGSHLTRAYSASSCSLWTRFSQKRRWSQAREVTWTWLIQFRASQSFQCSLPMLHAPEARCKNSPVTLSLSIEPQHCPCTSPARSYLLHPLAGSAGQSVHVMYVQVLRWWCELLLTRETRTWQEKKSVNTQPWNKLKFPDSDA